jgi:3-hydroxyacyl-CoA dehydrogenase / enoyl-CoA hydratase / 3-hydroxybutyryl-CoA epimerase
MRHMKIENAADGFATLTLDNADESMNLVSDAFITEMLEATARIVADDKVMTRSR